MHELFKKLGLSDKESTVFLALYEMGKATPAELSKKTSLKRPTVYLILEDLVQKEFVTIDTISKKQTYLARSPDELLGIEPLMKKQYEEQSKALHEVIETLKTQQQKQLIHIPRLIYIPEEQMESHLYARNDIWNRSVTDTNTELVSVQDYSFIKVFENWIEWYWKQPSSKDIILKLITNESIAQESKYEEEVMSKKTPENRIVKFWDELGELTYTTIVYGDYTLLAQTKVHPYSLIEIYDTAFAQNQRQIFYALWRQVIKKDATLSSF